MSDLASYLRTRRSSLSVSLEDPGPDANQLREIVTTGVRVPDHGKLAPWRIEAWERPARAAIHDALSRRLDDAVSDENTAKQRAGLDKLLHGPTVLAVISTLTEHPKIPQWEQILSAGAVCYNLLLASNAAGFEAQWLTAWYVYDDEVRPILGLNEGERIAGIIHIGTSSAAKSERSRPDVDTLFTIRER